MTRFSTKSFGLLCLTATLFLTPTACKKQNAAAVKDDGVSERPSEATNAVVQQTCDFINSHLNDDANARANDATLKGMMEKVTAISGGPDMLIACLKQDGFADAAMAPASSTTDSTSGAANASAFANHGAEHAELKLVKSCPRSWCGSVVMGFPWESNCGGTPETEGCSCLFLRCR